MSIPAIHAIIPAGGAGTRLWPLSRRDYPKFLLPLTDPERSLLQLTVLRLAPVCRSVTVVTGAAHAVSVEAQLRDLVDLPVRIVVEPSGRDSMPAIGVATALIADEWGEDALVGSFAADHVIGDDDIFRAHVVTAACTAQTTGRITTLGVRPTAPSTAYGYIQPGDILAPDSDARAVREFREKPDADTAHTLIDSGCLWNAGIFLMRADVLAHSLERYQPYLARGLRHVVNVWSDERARQGAWEALTPIAFDYAVAEPAATDGHVAVVELPETVGWCDLGDLDTLACLTTERGDEIVTARTHLIEAEGSVVLTRRHADLRDEDSGDGDNGESGRKKGRHVVVLGVEDCVVVDTDDVVFVVARRRAQDVKIVVDRLRESGLTDLL